jgi:DNA (cytosine-5)-methyltransferase 1
MKLLDLYCGAGGAAMGYARAGFDVTGVDLHPMPRYPFTFVQGDALRYLSAHARSFVAVHASPPCQAYSAMSACRPGLAGRSPDLIGRTRTALNRSRLPYVIENVPGSTVRPDLVLCGQMFGLRLYRHRLFESNTPLPQQQSCEHRIAGSKAGHWQPGQIISVSGHCAPIALAREAMGIDWMRRAELAEAIPPAYTEHIGAALRLHIEGGMRCAT